MNIKTANKLIELRKAHNLTQEELAAKLGVSRQAISKWECSEASPDSDNLIELANIYNVSLDELLDRNEASNVINDNKDNIHDDAHHNDHYFDAQGRNIYFKGDNVVIDDGTNPRVYSLQEFTQSYRKMRHTQYLVESIYMVMVVLAYILLGLLTEGWLYWYFLFILIPVVSSFIEVIYSKRIIVFNYPCLITAIYCGLGHFLNLWHPLWVLFITIPLFYVVTSIIDNATHANDFKSLEDAYRKYIK